MEEVNFGLVYREVGGRNEDYGEIGVYIGAADWQENVN